MLVTVTSSTAGQITLYRQLPDGTSAPVRTFDGGPLTLNGSGSSYSATVTDIEAPSGVPLLYIGDGASTNPVMLDTDVPWLVHLGKPALSVPLDLRKDSFTKRSRSTTRGLFAVSGRRHMMVISGGTRRPPESSFVFQTSELSEIEQVDALTADDSVLFFNLPASLGLGVPSMYVSVGDIDEDRTVDIGDVAQRHWRLPYLMVEAPLGGVAALGGTPGSGGPTVPGNRTMADLSLELAAELGRAATMADAAAKYSTMTAAATGSA